MSTFLRGRNSSPPPSTSRQEDSSSANSRKSSSQQTSVSNAGKSKSFFRLSSANASGASAADADGATLAGVAASKKRVNLAPDNHTLNLPPTRRGIKNQDAKLSARSGIDGLGGLDPDHASANLPANMASLEDVAHVREMLEDGHSAMDLQHLGISADTMREAGFTARELRSAEYTEAELSEAGFSSEAIKLAGFTPTTWSFRDVLYTSAMEGYVSSKIRPAPCRWPCSKHALHKLISACACPLVLLPTLSADPPAEKKPARATRRRVWTVAARGPRGSMRQSHRPTRWACWVRRDMKARALQSGAIFYAGVAWRMKDRLLDPTSVGHRPEPSRASENDFRRSKQAATMRDRIYDSDPIRDR